MHRLSDENELRKKEKIEQPSLLSSLGDDLAADTPASDDLPSLDNQVVTNGRQSSTANANDDDSCIRASNANVEPSYQNSAAAIRTSTTSNGIENEYANTKPNELTTTTKTNGSASPSVPQTTDNISDNNNSEHVNGNAGERNPLENNHSVAAATATGNKNKMEDLYDIPVGEFDSQNALKHKNQTKNKDGPEGDESARRLCSYTRESDYKNDNGWAAALNLQNLRTQLHILSNIL